MPRLLYEHSLSYAGHLIIPFIQEVIAQYPLFSYGLLSEQDHYGPFHQQRNPAGLFSQSQDGILAIAKEHLAHNGATETAPDYFKQRYLYQHHLVITHQQRDRCYYQHYPPTELRNIAAPRLFGSPQECLTWVKRGLDQQQSQSS